MVGVLQQPEISGSFQLFDETFGLRPAQQQDRFA